MIPLGCAPQGLKYRSRAPFHCSYGFPAFWLLRRWASTWSVMTVSIMTFVRPYVFVGPIGQCSGMGIMLGTRVASP